MPAMDVHQFETMIVDFRRLRERGERERREGISRFLSVWAEHFPPAEAEDEKPPTRLETDRPQRIERFLTEWGAAWENIAPPADFNTFSLLRRGSDEVIHTQFVAWLFDRHANHGQRHLFMTALLDLCGLAPRDGWERATLCARSSRGRRRRSTS